MTRKAIFDAIRDAKKAGLTQTQVNEINYSLDRAGVPKDGTMMISDKGIALIKEFEGTRLKAYQDSVGVWTIGVGHTKGVNAGDIITQDQADAFLRADLEDAETAVQGLCPVTTQNQFDALTSFAFNLGTGALKGSTLRTKHNAGDYSGAKAEFLRWVNAGGKKLDGLVRRRTAEAELYGS